MSEWMASFGMLPAAWEPLFLTALVGKATLVLLLSGAGAWLLRGARAATRHLLWTAAVAALLLLPLVAATVPGWVVPVLPALPAWLAGSGSVVAVADRAEFVGEVGVAGDRVVNGVGGGRASSAGAGAAVDGVSVGPVAPVPGAGSGSSSPEPIEPRLPLLPQAPGGSGAGALGGSSRAAPNEPETVAPSAADVEYTARARAARTGAAMPWISWLLLGWAAGAVGMFGWLLVGRWGVHRLVLRATPVNETSWLTLVRQLSADLGLRKPVALLYSEEALTPLASGVIWPSVLLPVGAAAWPVERRRAVLLHELAHVRRLDCFTQLLAQLACALFWFHPGAWYAARRLRMEREQACDDAVLGAGVRPSEYARQLLELAREFRSVNFAAAATVGMARPSELEGRLLAILDANRPRGGLPPRTRRLITAAGLLVLAPLGLLHPRARAAESPAAAVSEPATANAVNVSGGSAFAGHPSEVATATKRPNQVAVAPSADHRPGINEFRWQGRLAAGQTLEIQAINGGIQLVGSSSDVAEVRAVTTAGRRSSADDVHIEVIEGSGGVKICAVHLVPGARPRAGECETEDWRTGAGNDASVQFHVQLPAGVGVVAATINGGVHAENLKSDADLRSMNGGIQISTTGFARASTLNGGISASIGRDGWPDSLSLHSVNGSITLDVPADANADVQMETINGSLVTDFPLQVERRFINGSRATGLIGTGGTKLKLETTNGSIRLRSAGVQRSAERAAAPRPAPSPTPRVDPVPPTPTVPPVPPAPAPRSAPAPRDGEPAPPPPAASPPSAPPDPAVRNNVPVRYASSDRSASSTSSSYSFSTDQNVFKWKWVEDGRVAGMAKMVGDLGEEIARSVVQQLTVSWTGARGAGAAGSDDVQDPATTQEYIRRLQDDEHSGVRRAAAHALAQAPGDAVTQALADRLRVDVDASVREMAAWSLGQRRAANAISALSRALLQDSQAGVREMAAWALGQIASPAAAAALREAAVRDAADAVRFTSLWALELADSAAYVALAPSTIRDPSPLIRMRAAWVIGAHQLHDQTLPLYGALQDTDADVRAAAAWSLGRLGQPGSIQALRTALRDPFTGVRRAALWALSQSGDQDARTAAAAAINDENPEIRSLAMLVSSGQSWAWPWPWPIPMPRPMP